MHTQRLVGVIALGLGLTLALLVGLHPARAGPAALTRYVAVEGNDDGGANPCLVSTSPCRTVQHAVDVAACDDEIRVATGVYTGVQFRGGVTQVVYINNSVTIRGGYTTTNWTTPDPLTRLTVLDAQGQGRVVCICGGITPTLDGFVIANGRASEGAGVEVCAGAAPIIRNNVITNNIAFGGWGGGTQVENSNALLEHNRIVSNATPFEGGGVSIVFDSRVTLKNNLIAGNFADTRGAGVRMRDVTVVLLNNTIAHNTGVGGEGVYAANTAITLANNIIVSNTYGLRTDGTLTATIMYNDVWSNTMANYSGLADPTGSNGNISQDPLFTKGPDGDYYLSQVAAGQVANSPAVNAGSASAAALGLDDRSTRTDERADSGTVDMGYHYRAINYRVYLPLVLRNY
jgi:hypothetical protein